LASLNLDNPLQGDLRYEATRATASGTLQKITRGGGETLLGGLGGVASKAGRVGDLFGIREKALTGAVKALTAAFKPLTKVVGGLQKAGKKLLDVWGDLAKLSEELAAKYAHQNAEAARQTHAWQKLREQVSRGWAQTLEPLLKDISPRARKLSGRWEAIQQRLIQNLTPWIERIVPLLEKGAHLMLDVYETLAKLPQMLSAFANLLVALMRDLASIGAFGRIIQGVESLVPRGGEPKPPPEPPTPQDTGVPTASASLSPGAAVAAALANAGIALGVGNMTGDKEGAAPAYSRPALPLPPTNAFGESGESYAAEIERKRAALEKQERATLERAQGYKPPLPLSPGPAAKAENTHQERIRPGESEIEKEARKGEENRHSFSRTARAWEKFLKAFEPVQLPQSGDRILGIPNRFWTGGKDAEIKKDSKHWKAILPEGYGPESERYGSESPQKVLRPHDRRTGIGSPGEEMPEKEVAAPPTNKTDQQEGTRDRPTGPQLGSATTVQVHVRDSEELMRKLMPILLEVMGHIRNYETDVKVNEYRLRQHGTFQ